MPGSVQTNYKARIPERAVEQLSSSTQLRVGIIMSSEDSEHAVSGVRRLMIRNMQKMSSEDSEYAENVPGDSEYAENVLGGFGTCLKWLRRLGKCRKWRRKASTVIYRE